MTARLHHIEASPDLVERVYRALLDAICDGTLRPGQRVMQEELAEQLAVSRQPVMQALRLLRKDGFVQDAPLISGPSARTRGLQVSPLDAGLIAQVYQVRGALDLLAVRLATARRARIAPALLAAGRKAVQGSEIKAMIDADAAFHCAIYEAAGNPLIAESAQLHWQHIRRAMGLALQLHQIRKPVWAEHEAIAEAIADGDLLRAEQLMGEHTGKAALTLTEQLALPDAGREASPNPNLRGRRQQL